MWMKVVDCYICNECNNLLGRGEGHLNKPQTTPPFIHVSRASDCDNDFNNVTSWFQNFSTFIDDLIVS
jgi:NADH:ubiquinone oxidoreductase subunit F (NADH-binding)